MRVVLVRYLRVCATMAGLTDSGTVVQIHGNGPFAITYVNPEDDPSKGTTKASD
jgi:hypothetical protein